MSCTGACRCPCASNRVESSSPSSGCLTNWIPKPPQSSAGRPLAALGRTCLHLETRTLSLAGAEPAHDAMRLEQAIFTSVRSERLDGYQLAARSAGVSDEL